MTDTTDLFVYGALQDADIQQVVIGRIACATPDTLAGFDCLRVEGRLFPTLAPNSQAQASGAVLHDLTAAEMRAVDFYLDAALFACAPVKTASGRITRTHMPQDGALSASTSWNLADWQLRHKEIALEVAIQIMRSYVVANPQNTPLFHHGLDMRAQSVLRAQKQSAPIHIRRGFSQSDITAKSRSQPYCKYFAVEEVSIRHRHFDDTVSDVLERAVFVAADAVTILPYDPVTDQVVIVEQFRAAAYVRDDPHPWVLEPVAGRCDADEPVEETARREVKEEAGLEVRKLEEIGTYYATPGAMTEYIYSYVAIVDLLDAKQSTHGLEGEGENILTHVLPFETAMALMQNGEADCGPLWISLLWLQQHRTRLRAEQAGA